MIAVCKLENTAAFTQHLNPVADVGAIAAPVQICYQVGEILIKEQVRGAAILQNVFEFIRH